jgi:hypothetical protein
MRSFLTTFVCWLLVAFSSAALSFLLFWDFTRSPRLGTVEDLRLPLIVLYGLALWLSFMLAVIRSSFRVRQVCDRLAPRFRLAEFWKRLVAEPAERASDAVKDALLDFWPSTSSEIVEPPEASTEPLPLLDREQFAATLRGKVEETLERVANVINAAPTGKDIAGSEEQVCNLLAELLCDAVALGLQMRADAASTASTDSEQFASLKDYAPTYRKARCKPLSALYYQLVWAEKYRLLRSAGIAGRLAQRSQKPYTPEE